MHTLVPEDKTVIDLSGVDMSTGRIIMNPEDFSLSFVLGGRIAFKMTAEQWQAFVRTVMRSWA